MKSTYAILLTVATALVLAPAFSGCGGEAEAPKQEAKDLQSLQEQQKQIIQRERGDLSSRKAARKG